MSFNKQVADTLLEFGASRISSDASGEKFNLDTMVGPLIFTLFTNETKGVFSIYARTTSEEQTKVAAPIINSTFMAAGSEAMNRFSGKFNIHEYTANEALAELERRLTLLCDKK